MAPSHAASMALPASLHVHPHFNAEEAAHAAADLVASLDNLPGEVVFLLEEIKEKDIRINQLITRINTRHIGLTKQAKSLAAGSLPPPTSVASTPPATPGPGASLPTAHLSHKDAQALTKIQAEWGKVEVLQEEKIRLAERMERIVGRARERARAEWEKVGGMEVDDIDGDKLPVAGGMLGELGGGEVVLPLTGLGSGVDRPQKKRKPNALPLPPSFSQSIVHPPSTTMLPPPPPIHPRPSLSGRSTHSHHRRHQSFSTLSDADVDAEGEQDTAEQEEGGVEGEADDTLYCHCQQKSYGEMIGCDNEKCEFEWFHVKCVDISGPLPDTWYCPDCVRKLGLSSSDGSKIGGQNRKGRKK